MYIDFHLIVWNYNSICIKFFFYFLIQKEARTTILEVINECIDGPAEMSPYAPRIITTTVPVDKIGKVIGPKGR